MISFQTNIDSLIAQQNLNVNSKFQSNTIQQLTSGYRINSSGDDAAGLSVANQDRDQIAQITQGVANGNNGTAQLQIMDGGMSNISQILDRLQTLAAQSASSSFTGSRTDLNAEFQSDITELNRQAQAIGLNTGGTFAQTMDVYLGGGGGANTGAVSQNAQVTVDLSKSTVDAHSLGLAGMGMQVVAGTADISSNSSTHSAYQILQNATNTTGLGGKTTFYLSGPGFSDGAKVGLSVNLSGVNDTNTLVTAINSAITAAVASTTNPTQAAALKAAGITASVNTDASGGQELAFSSNTTAFQVQAGDRMANALMGNLSSGSTGTAIATTVSGANITDATSGTNFAENVTLQISGASLSSPVSFAVTGAKMSDAIAAIKTAVNTAGSTTADALAAAGISVSQTGSGAPLTFTSATGEAFSVQATGDTQNLLGLGSLDLSSAGTAFYSTTASTTYGANNTGNGLVTLGFSLNGGTTDGGIPATDTNGTPPTAATITGGSMASVLDASTTANTSTWHNLHLTVNSVGVDINFDNDANGSANNAGVRESLTNVVQYINSQVNAKMGWGSDVHLASVTGSGGTAATVTLTDPINDSSSAGTLTVDTTSSAAAPLGLASAVSTSGTDAAGNTVVLNLAGGNATKAVYNNTPTAATATAMTSGMGVATGASTITFNIDGVTGVAANFASDANRLGTVATMTGNTIGAADGTGPVNIGSLLTPATLTTAGIGTTDDTFTATAGAYITINGAHIDISAATSLQDIVADINFNTGAALFTSGGAVTAQEVAMPSGNFTLALTSAAVGTGANITLGAQGNGGLGIAGLLSSDTAVGGVSNKLTLNIDNKGSIAIDFTGDTLSGGNESLNSVVNTIKAQLTSSGTYGATYAAGVSVVNGAIQIAGLGKGSTSAASVSVSQGPAGLLLGLNSKPSAANVVNGQEESVSNVVSFLNTTAQKALGTTTGANIFSVDGNGKITINSQTEGKVSSVSGFVGSGTNGAAMVTTLGLGSPNLTGTAGAGPTLDNIATTLTNAFASNATLNKAGIQATSNGGTLTIASTSTNNTSFRLAEYDTNAGTTLGFTKATGAFSAALNSGKSLATLMDAGGTSAIGTGTTASPYLSFAPMLFGTDAQALTISANNAAGVPQPLTITLRNDTTNSQAGASIDSAVSYINQQLQGSKNTTLQSIVAVKEKNADGTEGINFLSSLSSFSVSVGSSINGNGINAGVAKTFGSVSNGAANNSAIDTLAGAQAAVTAVTAAVAALGSAQATVGKGENQLSYAVNLAQSQITNISAAQSQIRDANVAQEAANMTKAQVLQQATIAAMAQANQEPQAVLSLLKQ